MSEDEQRWARHVALRDWFAQRPVVIEPDVDEKTTAPTTRQET